MTNPNDAIGTNAAYGGRTSTNAFNDVLTAFTRGVLSGWECVPNAGMTVSVGGDGSNRDVAIAEDNAGNKTSINNISESPVDITMNAAPASNTRIDVIVAYVDNPATGNSSEADNPDACGIIPVSGTPSATPIAPNESAIRTAITADGASGTTAYYVILAYITIPSGTTDITSGNITQGGIATTSKISIGTNGIATNMIQNNAVTASKIDFSTFGDGNYSTSEQDTGFTWTDGKTIYKKTINFGALPNATSKTLNLNIANLDTIVNSEAFCKYTNGINFPIPFTNTNDFTASVMMNFTSTQISITTGSDRSGATGYVTVYYTKV